MRDLQGWLGAGVAGAGVFHGGWVVDARERAGVLGEVRAVIGPHFAAGPDRAGVRAQRVDRPRRDGSGFGQPPAIS
jgi:hypothetical protein